MRRLLATCCLVMMPMAAVAEPLVDAGTYTPSAFAKANQNGTKAVLLHVVSKFCAVCEEQRAGVIAAAEMALGVDKYAVTMSVPMETWKDSRIMTDIGAERAGTLVLVKDGEVLGSVETADPNAIAALLMPLLPGGGGMIDPVTGLPLDPVTGYPLDPTTGFPIDPVTGVPFDPATGQPVS